MYFDCVLCLIAHFPSRVVLMDDVLYGSRNSWFSANAYLLHKISQSILSLSLNLLHTFSICCVCVSIILSSTFSNLRYLIACSAALWAAGWWQVFCLGRCKMGQNGQMHFPECVEIRLPIISSSIFFLVGKSPTEGILLGGVILQQSSFLFPASLDFQLCSGPTPGLSDALIPN